MEINVTELIDGVLRGEKKFNDKLYKKIKPIAYKTCMRYTTSKGDGEDLIQECIIKVFDNINKFNGDDYKSLGSWVKTICINNCIDYYRKNKNKPHTINDIEYSVDVDDGEDDIKDKYTLDEILKAVERLDPRYQSVFKMFFLDGQSHNEITKTLDLNKGASTSILFKAKKKLKKILEIKNN